MAVNIEDISKLSYQTSHSYQTYDNSKPIQPLPIIKVDINGNSYKNWEAAFADKEERFPLRNYLKTAELIHNDSEFLPPVLTPTVFYSKNTTNKADDFSTVFGKDAKDIPTSYSIPKLAAHELPAIGTLVHEFIVPGFPYRVRLNGSDEYLFEGEALVLQAVGQGYGKRLTFESEDILDNRSFFWSDSSPPNGFAISMHLQIRGEFVVKPEEGGKQLGKAAKISVCGDQIIKKIQSSEDDTIEMEFLTKMTCKLALPNKGATASEMTLEGVAIATKSALMVHVNRIEQVNVPGFGICIFEKS